MPRTIHPVCQQIRDLRSAAKLSLGQFEEQTGFNAIRLGSYERGDRTPPITAIEDILNHYGYTLMAVPKDQRAVRLPADIAAELRAIANQLERTQAGNVIELARLYD